ncbi:symplekin isoform X2 [Cucumis melo var. makuwa]|uniref:Symplekin isoform X2 n=1 Tax=Cucumis melo var. makuwa TaxID=1194695 RepID=A0A5D3E0M8_CUCMM|nr:symplekin isoform X2 [Cucumis melo var. makuwa]
MVGMVMAVNSRERLYGLINSTKIASDIPSKLARLRQLKNVLLPEDPVLLSELLPRILELQSDRFSPIRKFVTEYASLLSLVARYNLEMVGRCPSSVKLIFVDIMGMIGEIGFKHIDLLPQIVPLLITVLTDDTPAVVRQSITCAIDLFRISLVKIAMKGLYSSEIDNSLQSLWTWMLKFKEEIYSIAVHGNGGMSLLALKFVVEVILLYTPDPSVSTEPPACEENSVDFNISWLRGGHPILKIRDLSTEASQSLGLLLDQLRFPKVKSLNNTKIIVLINSLSTIANRRPAFYGRILPVLLGLDRSGTIFNGLHAPGVHFALKNAFLNCLKCTHPGALPWRDPLIGAVREMKVRGGADPSLHQVSTVNGSVKEEQGDDHLDEKAAVLRTSNIMHNNLGRKRAGETVSCDLSEDGNGSGKRARPTTNVSDTEEPSKEIGRSTVVSKQNASSSGTLPTEDVDTGPAQQLVTMFGALVAQGEKAIGSLQILISSISADLLAELVIANMRFLPPHQPDTGGGELLQNMCIVGSDVQAKYPSSFVADVLSLSSTFPPIASLFDSSRSLSDHMKPEEEEDHNAVPVPIVDSAGTNHDSENAITPTSLPGSKTSISGAEEVCSIIPSSIHDMGNLESGIPGLDSSVQSDGMSDTVVTPSLASSGFDESNQENISTLDLTSSKLSGEKSEELSPKAVVSDVNSLASSTATSAGVSFQLVLPKMSAPVVDLVDEEKDELLKLAFVRIVEAYKQIAVAGGSQARFSLLAYLGVEYPLELEAWKVLQNHILADYVNNEGHELTLRVLYRLFGEAEEEHDFFTSTTAASVYETFLLTVAETLKDSFPPSDKSLSRLLGEAPYLPKSVINLLECMCSPGNSENADKDTHSGDRVTQGLSAVWSLILLRPPIRDVCLKIALQSTVHLSEEVRMKAIRLVANKLYPIPSISQRIEDFSKEMLLSAISDLATDMTDADGLASESYKDAHPEKSLVESSAISKDISSDTHPSSISQADTSLPISEAQRRMSLYFALCTKKHSLFRQIFVMYKDASKAIKQAVHDHIPILVRTMGSSSDLLEILTDPPSGSENLVMQVLHILTDGIIPSSELVFTISKLYNSKLKDVEIMIPVLPYLPKDEVMMIFPRIVNLPGDKFQAALLRILQGSSQSGPVLNPAEVLIAIHGIDPDRDGIPLKKVTDACNACFEHRQTFTQQIIAKVLNQLVEQIPLPLLFMRTVLQAIGTFPALVDFIMEILSRLVGKQIWKYPKLWVGFLKCVLLTKPQSFNVLLQLPPAQLENALNKTAALKAPLVAHASQPNIQSTLPRAVLTVLGITLDAQNSSQVQSSQTNMVDSSNSEKEVAVPEKSKESSVAG